MKFLQGCLNRQQRNKFVKKSPPPVDEMKASGSTSRGINTNRPGIRDLLDLTLGGRVGRYSRGFGCELRALWDHCSVEERSCQLKDESPFDLD